MRKKINIAVIAILISTLTTSGIATGSQAIKVKASTLDSRIEGDGEALVTDEGDVMVPEGSGDGHDVEVDPAEYYGFGYTGEEITGVLEKEEKVDKKESKDKKVKKGKKKKVVVKKGVVKKKEEQAKKAEEAKKKAEETKKKDNTKQGNKGKYKTEREAMRKSLLGVKGKVLAKDDMYGAPLVIQQGDRLLLSDWQKKVDAYYGIERDAKGWRLFNPKKGICPDHGADGSTYDPYCEYRQEEIDKMIKWEKEHRNE